MDRLMQIMITVAIVAIILMLSLIVNDSVVRNIPAQTNLYHKCFEDGQFQASDWCCEKLNVTK